MALEHRPSLSISREGKGKTGIQTSGIGKKAQQSDCVIKIEQSIIVRSKFEQTKHITYSKQYQEKNMSTPTAMIKVYELFITWQILFKPWFRVWDFQRFFDVFFVVLVELVKASGRACTRTLHLRKSIGVSQPLGIPSFFGEFLPSLSLFPKELLELSIS